MGIRKPSGFIRDGSTAPFHAGGDRRLRSIDQLIRVSARPYAILWRAWSRTEGIYCGNCAACDPGRARTCDFAPGHTSVGSVRFSGCLLRCPEAIQFMHFVGSSTQLQPNTETPRYRRTLPYLINRVGPDFYGEPVRCETPPASPAINSQIVQVDSRRAPCAQPVYLEVGQ